MSSAARACGSAAGSPVVLALLEPWRWLAQRPPLRWLVPQQSVRLLRADGSAGLWLGDEPATGDPSRARFVAVEMPADQVLLRSLRLPTLAPDDVRAAVALEVQASSPFERGELVHGWRSDDLPGGGVQVHIALCARRAVRACIDAHPDLGRVPEVWVLDARQRPIVLEGFGEAARQRQGHRGVWLGGALALVALALLLALAVTPTAQLKLRAMQASAAFAMLQQRAATPLAQRDTLMQLQADMEALREATADQVEPLAVMDVLTRLVPDDTWLQRLQVIGQRVVISGQTPNTAALMNALSAHPDVKDVRAPTAATRAMGGTRENFTVELQMRPRGTGAAATDAAAATPGATGTDSTPSAATPTGGAS